MWISWSRLEKTESHPNGNDENVFYMSHYSLGGKKKWLQKKINERKKNKLLIFPLILGIYGISNTTSKWWFRSIMASYNQVNLIEKWGDP